MISESLKINTTLTELDLSCEEKIMKMKEKIGNRRGLMKLINEQITILEQKERR